jgi:hypothetical protein
MYVPDDLDTVVYCDLAPPHSAGAPMPFVLATDNELLLSYEIAPAGLEIAVVIFAHPRAHYFGPPNDEALNGHPLFSRGLKPNGIFEVLLSSWIRSLNEISRLHPLYNPERYLDLRHFIFSFHDTTFEVVAEGVKAAKRFDQTNGGLANLKLKELMSFAY